LFCLGICILIIYTNSQLLNNKRPTFIILTPPLSYSIMCCSIMAGRLLEKSAGARMISTSLSHRASVTLCQLYFLSYIDATPTGLCGAFGNGFLLRCRPYGGFAIHSKVKQTLEKPAFTQFREFLHDSRLAGRPLEKSAGARLGFGLAQPPCFFWPYKRRPPAGLYVLGLTGFDYNALESIKILLS